MHMAQDHHHPQVVPMVLNPVVVVLEHMAQSLPTTIQDVLKTMEIAVAIMRIKTSSYLLDDVSFILVVASRQKVAYN